MCWQGEIVSWSRAPLVGNNKQLLDEVENDIINYQCRGLSYLPKPDMKFDNSFYDAKTKFSICFITIFSKTNIKKRHHSEFAKVWEHYMEKG